MRPCDDSRHIYLDTFRSFSCALNFLWDVFVVIQRLPTLPALKKPQNHLRDSITTPFWWLLLHHALAHNARLGITSSTYDHLISHIFPYPKSLDLMIRHDPSVPTLDYVLRHLRPREFWVHTLYADRRLLMCQTIDEARQSCFRRTIRTPAMIRNALIARRSQEDDFAITRIKWICHPRSPQMRQYQLCLYVVSITTNCSKHNEHTMPIAPKTLTANVSSTLPISIFSILSMGVITPAQ
jgi:hypothetical protein